jgi:formylglycine-generating enzyme required for sulfatase activity
MLKIVKPLPFAGLLLALAVTPACRQSEETRSYLESLKKRTLEQLVFVEGGTFMMGDVGYVDENGIQRYFTNDPDTQPVHQVTLTSYSIQAYEVTFGDFDFYTTLMGDELVGKRYLKEEYRKPNYPADILTWYQARAYCQWLGEQIGYPMDLPTEAQWEYAARSRGQAVRYATNNDKREIGINIRDPKVVWHAMPVGSWPPNPLGLYDMTGNVDEWTLDLWHPYFEESLTDPSYNTEEDAKYAVSRMVRGLGWDPLYRRAKTLPDNTGANVGMRCVANHPEPIKSLR